MKNTKYILAAVIAALILFIGWNFFSVDSPKGDQSSDTQPTQQLEGSAVVIVFQDGKYSPADVTINKGERVTFMNESDSAFWPATNLHPRHTGYPGSDMAKCESEDAAGNIFDACEPIEPGGQYGFVFHELGEWPYHDHLRPSAGGTITVK